MKKAIYFLALAIAVAIMIYFYFINFDNMSEEMLINSMLIWYIPFVFGMYGLTALRIKKTIDESTTSVLKHIFSAKDKTLTILTVIIGVLSGIIGIVLFFIPISIVKIDAKNYDIRVASLSVLIWLIGLVFFFIILWPML